MQKNKKKQHLFREMIVKSLLGRLSGLENESQIDHHHVSNRVSSLWPNVDCSRKSKGNHIMTILYMILVKVSYYQPNVCFCRNIVAPNSCEFSQSEKCFLIILTAHECTACTWEREGPWICYCIIHDFTFFQSSFSLLFASGSSSVPFATFYQTQYWLEVATLVRVVWKCSANAALVLSLPVPFLHDEYKLLPPGCM